MHFLSFLSPSLSYPFLYLVRGDLLSLSACLLMWASLLFLSWMASDIIATGESGLPVKAGSNLDKTEHGSGNDLPEFNLINQIGNNNKKMKQRKIQHIVKQRINQKWRKNSRMKEQSRNRKTKQEETGQIKPKITIWIRRFEAIKNDKHEGETDKKPK